MINDMDYTPEPEPDYSGVNIKNFLANVARLGITIEFPFNLGVMLFKGEDKNAVEALRNFVANNPIIEGAYLAKVLHVGFCGIGSKPDDDLDLRRICYNISRASSEPKENLDENDLICRESWERILHWMSTDYTFINDGEPHELPTLQGAVKYYFTHDKFPASFPDFML